jgi:hypothetical protein
MAVYDEIMWSRGFRRVEPPKPLGGSARTIAFQGHRQVAVPLPSPASATYEREMTDFNSWRGTVSPLGGVVGGPYGYAPKRGQEALRPEYRSKAWSGSVPWQAVPRDMSGFQFKPKGGGR